MKKIMLFVILLILIHAFNYKLNASSSMIFISEILPDADGADAGKEWIELYNNSNSAMNLKDYYFINRSLSGTERKILIASSINISSKQYYLISEGAQTISSENVLILGSGKLNMYNDESDLELYDPDGALIDKVHYSKPTEAKSLERKGPENVLDCNRLVTNPNGNTIMTDNLSRDPVCFGQVPVSNPVITQPQDTCVSIGVITSNLVGSTICTRGYLTVEPNKLGDKIFYIMDGGLGFKVKLKDNPTISLKVGDKVELSGEVRSVQDGLYLNTDSVIKVGQSNIYPTQLNNLENQKYSLVNYTGEIMKNYSKSTDLEYGDSTIRVSVLASTDIEMPTRTLGDNLKITGILIEEGGIFKILPRYQDDLIIEDKEIVSESTVKTQETAKDQSETKEVPIPVSYIAINKSPSLTISRSEQEHEKLYKYSLGRGWIFLLLLMLVSITLLVVFRNKIIGKLKDLKLLDINLKPVEISNQNLDFEKDKYELMFGANTSLEGE